MQLLWANVLLCMFSHLSPASSQNISPKYGRIVTIGDSMFNKQSAYIETLRGLLDTAVVVNARGGAKVEEIAKQQACSMDPECKWSVMNDAPANVWKADGWQETFEALVDREVDAGRKVIIVGHPLHGSYWAAEPEYQILMDKFASMASTRADVWFIDPRKNLIYNSSWSYYAKDKRHPSEDGTKVFATSVAELIMGDGTTTTPTHPTPSSPTPPPATPAPSTPSSPAPLVTGGFTIDQASVTRSVHVNVPDGAGPFPVIILLHGGGGSGTRTLNSWTSAKTTFKPFQTSHVLVAPDGHENSWNIIDEKSKMDDVCFITMIINYLAIKPNVNANHVQLFGKSNGAALVNRIFIESGDTRIVRGVTVVSQLNERQYRNGNFYIGGSSNTYSQVQPSLVPREILAVQGAKDEVIPANGGASKIGSMVMNSDADSIYAYAVAYGYTGPQLSEFEASSYKSWSYLAGAVSSYTVKEEGHGAPGRDAEVLNAVVEFLQRPGFAQPARTPASSPSTCTAIGDIGLVSVAAILQTPFTLLLLLLSSGLSCGLS